MSVKMGAPSIGQDITIDVHTANRKTRNINEKGIEQCAKYFEQFGPKDISENFEFEFSKSFMETVT